MKNNRTASSWSRFRASRTEPAFAFPGAGAGSIPEVPIFGTAPARVGWGVWAFVRRHWAVLTMLVAVAGLNIGTSFSPNLFDETEGQYAGGAREMLSAGDWLVPTNNGIPRLQKPPVVYWLIGLSLKTFGYSDFAARLPNALATVAWVFVIFLIGRKIGGELRGLFSAIIFASCFGVFIFSHMIMPETFLGLCISLTFWCFLKAWEKPAETRSWYLGAWFCMGLGVMVKGLHAALIPLAAALVTALVYRKTRGLWRGLWTWQGLLLFMLLVVPWYAAIAIRFPGFLTDHFVNEQVGHVVHTRYPPDCEQVSFGLFWFQHLFFLFPWVLFIPAAIWSRYRLRSTQAPGQVSASVTGEGMLMIWILLMVVGVAVSSRQDYYTMTAWGAFAVWLAKLWTQRTALVQKSLLGGFGVLILLAVVGLGVAIFILSQDAPSSMAVKPAVARGDFFNGITGFSFGAWRDYTLLMICSALALLAAGIAGARFVRRDRPGAAVLALGFGMMLILICASRGYAKIQDYFSLKKIAQTINQQSDPAMMVVCEGEPHLNASLFFYLDRHTYWVGARPDGDFAQRMLQIGSDRYLDAQAVANHWLSGQRVFFITEQANLSHWQSALRLTSSQIVPLTASGTRILLVNRPAG